MSDDDTHTYYRVVNTDSGNARGGVFGSEQKANRLAAHLNEEYTSEYEVKEVAEDEFSFEEMTRGRLVYDMEIN